MFFCMFFILAITFEPNKIQKLSSVLWDINVLVGDNKWPEVAIQHSQILGNTLYLTYFRYVLQLFWQLLINWKTPKWTNCIFVSKDILTITPYYLTYFHYVLQFFWHVSAFSLIFFQIRMVWQSFEWAIPILHRVSLTSI